MERVIELKQVWVGSGGKGGVEGEEGGVGGEVDEGGWTGARVRTLDARSDRPINDDYPPPEQSSFFLFLRVRFLLLLRPRVDFRLARRRQSIQYLEECSHLRQIIYRSSTDHPHIVNSHLMI